MTTSRSDYVLSGEFTLLDWGHDSVAGKWIKLGIGWEDVPTAKAMKGEPCSMTAGFDSGDEVIAIGAFDARILFVGRGAPWIKVEVDDYEAFIKYHKEILYIGFKTGDKNQLALPMKPKGGPISKKAAMLCEDRDFVNWLNLGGDNPAKYLREYCQVESRAELDHNDDAAKRFNELYEEYTRDMMI